MKDIVFIKGVDTNRIQCNDIITTWKLFGIEAARKAIIRELRNVADGLKKVHFHHVSILVDYMCFDGSLITSIDRHGMMRQPFSPLKKASFEVPVDRMIEAALYNETDDMKSVSSRSMTGQLPYMGTGLTQVIMNNNIIKKVDTIEEFNLNIKGWNELKPNSIIHNVISDKKEDDSIHAGESEHYVPPSLDKF